MPSDAVMIVISRIADILTLITFGAGVTHLINTKTDRTQLAPISISVTIGHKTWTVSATSRGDWLVVLAFVMSVLLVGRGVYHGRFELTAADAVSIAIGAATFTGLMSVVISMRAARRQVDESSGRLRGLLGKSASATREGLEATRRLFGDVEAGFQEVHRRLDALEGTGGDELSRPPDS